MGGTLELQVQRNLKNHDNDNYYLYEVAVDGCFSCVRYFVEVKYVLEEMSSEKFRCTSDVKRLRSVTMLGVDY